MIDQFAKAIEQLVDGAQKLGNLNPCSIWALLSICLAVTLVYILRQNSLSRRIALSVRLEEAKVDGSITNAIEKMANEIKELRHIIELFQREGPHDKAT